VARFIPVIIFLFCSTALALEDFDGSLFALKFYAETPGFDFTFRGIESKREVQFNPNAAQLTGVSVYLYGFLGVGYGFKNPLSDSEKVKKGETDYEDWRLSFAFSRFHLTMNYQSYDGFYIKNTSSVDPLAIPFMQSPELKLENGSANFTFIWNPERFSLEAALDQTVRQEMSGGSWLLGAAVSRTRFSDIQPIIPSQVRGQFGDDQNIEEGEFLALTAKVGYGYTIAWSKKWFTSMALQLGGGQQRRKYRDANLTREGWHTATKYDALLTTGYNGDRIFSGLGLMADATSYKTSSLEIISNIWSAKLFVGARL